MPYVFISKASEYYNVNSSTLRRWDKLKKIQVRRTPAGYRQFYIPGKETDIIEENIQDKICYCRVSSLKQKDDLERQISYMRERFPSHKILSDIGSGINWNRKSLCSILEQANKGIIKEVVVAHRDRLCRFAFELIERMLKINGVKLVVLNQEIHSSPETELAEDIMSIIQVFACRRNGRRKYTQKK